jgi:hypothetical protein
MQLPEMPDKYYRIHIALPLVNELEYLPGLMGALAGQDYQEFNIYACVNQPDNWWDKKDQVHKCLNNQQTISYLKGFSEFQVNIIDRSSRGKGWKGKDFGVGWARKTVMNAIERQSHMNDLIVSLDADTVFNPGYFSSLLESFNRYKEAVAMAVPYYHPLIDDEEANLAMLRYEIYMRNYNIQLMRIKSPYSFTALGSAMVVPVWAYRAIGGMTPKKSGEDFYFLQKLRKYGNLLIWNRERVFPGTRFSDRVFFGTGPAMIRGRAGDWSSYPLYHHSFFNHIKNTYDLLPGLYEDPNIPTPLDEFMKKVFGEANVWKPILNNSRSREQFIRACNQKLDGLRLLQYLKSRQGRSGMEDDDCLHENYPARFTGRKLDNMDDLCMIRDELTRIEEKQQQELIIL